MATRSDIFATLGRITVHFATLEAQLEEGLCILANNENPAIAATILERATLARKVQLLERLIKFKATVMAEQASQERHEAELDRLKQHNAFMKQFTAKFLNHST